jgi:hypothetical protein
MKVELIVDWMGNKTGTIIDLMLFTAKQMVMDKRAKFIDAAAADKEIDAPQSNKKLQNRRDK